MNKDDHRTVSELVEDIVVWGERVAALTGKTDLGNFRSDEVLHLAVWKCVEVVGEAFSRLLKTKFGSGNPELRTELRQASDMRNRLTHGYPGVDLAILWSTARQFVPALVQRVRTAFVEYDGRD